MAAFTFAFILLASIAARLDNFQQKLPINQNCSYTSNQMDPCVHTNPVTAATDFCAVSKLVTAVSCSYSHTHNYEQGFIL